MPTPPAQLPIEPLVGPFDVTIADLPGSKSLTNRALLLAALAEGTSTLTNVLFSDDTRVMMDALAKLGFKLDIDELARTVTVEGRGGAIPSQTAELHLGNAGTAMRFLTAACCLGAPGSVYTLDGVPRMRQRPIGQLVDALCALGAKIEYLGEEGFPPLRIHACGLAGGEIALHYTISSQYISALTMIGPRCENGLEMNLGEHVTSRPYVDMTATIMREFGFDFGSKKGVYERISSDSTIHHMIRTPHMSYKKNGIYNIEPDASNASYFFAAAAIWTGSTVRIEGLHSTSCQGDVGFAYVLRAMGCRVVSGPGGVEGNYLELKSEEALHPPSEDLWDLNQTPDMAQTLAVVALFAEGKTTIRNVGNLRVKETDRIAALRTELTKLGATVTAPGNDITITPPAHGKLTPAAIDTYDDHRMAMSFAVAGLRAPAPGIVINDPGCVSKTFPQFFEYLARLRA